MVFWVQAVGLVRFLVAEGGGVSCWVWVGGLLWVWGVVFLGIRSWWVCAEQLCFGSWWGVLSSCSLGAICSDHGVWSVGSADSGLLVDAVQLTVGELFGLVMHEVV